MIHFIKYSPMKKVILLMLVYIFTVNIIYAQSSYRGSVTYNPPNGIDGCVYNVDVSIVLKAAGNYVNIKYDIKIVSVSAIIHSGKRYSAGQLPASVITYHENPPAWTKLPINYTINTGSNSFNYSSKNKSSIAVSQFLGESISHETSVNEARNNRARSLISNGSVSITNVTIDGPLQYDRTPLAEYFAEQ